jgi:hypothetical protein
MYIMTAHQLMGSIQKIADDAHSVDRNVSNKQYK